MKITLSSSYNSFQGLINFRCNILIYLFTKRNNEKKSKKKHEIYQVAQEELRNFKIGFLAKNKIHQRAFVFKFNLINYLSLFKST